MPTPKCVYTSHSAQFRPGGSGRGFKEERRGGGPPSIVSSRYRRSPPRYGDRRRSRYVLESCNTITARKFSMPCNKPREKIFYTTCDCT